MTIHKNKLCTRKMKDEGRDHSKVKDKKTKRQTISNCLLLAPPLNSSMLIIPTRLRLVDTVLVAALVTVFDEVAAS